MSDETEKKPEEEKKAEEDKPEDKEKHSDSANISETKAIAEALSKVADAVSKNTEALSKMDEKVSKALEEPTNLPAKPAVSAEDDIGDKIKVPDTYQSNSQQASIDDSDPKNKPEKDPSGLKMQEKSVQTLEKTSTPRPSTVNESLETVPTIGSATSSALQQVEKSFANSNKNPVLEAFRTQGLENRDSIAKAIMRGDFYKPTDEEVALF